MTVITLEIRPFGVFRSFGTMRCTVEAGCNVADVKKALVIVLGMPQEQLVMDSVLADEDKILPASTIFDKPAILSILPPVCGG